MRRKSGKTRLNVPDGSENEKGTGGKGGIAAREADGKRTKELDLVDSGNAISVNQSGSPISPPGAANRMSKPVVSPIAKGLTQTAYGTTKRPWGSSKTKGVQN